MDPLTISLLAGTMFSNVMGGMNAKDTAQQNLDFQRQSLADQLRFAKAGRTDAYGNVQTFNDATNQWETKLTPQQQALIKAGEHEQLTGLTHDAAQNRMIRDALARRAGQAGEDYNTARAGYLYKQPPSEDAIRSEITDLITQSKGTAERQLSELSKRRDIRTQGNLPIIKTGSITGGKDYGAELADTMLEARKNAMAEHMARVQGHASEYLPAMGAFERTAAAGGNAPVQFSSTPGDLAKQQSSMADIIAGIYKSSGSTLNNASNALVKAEGGIYPSMGDTAKMVEAINKNKGKAGTTDEPGYYGGSPDTNWRLSDFANPTF